MAGLLTLSCLSPAEHLPLPFWSSPLTLSLDFDTINYVTEPSIRHSLNMSINHHSYLKLKKSKHCELCSAAGGQKVLTTMKTLPSNMVTMNKNAPNKQTIVITKPQAGGRPATQQIIVVTTASGLRTVQAISTSQAGQGKPSVSCVSFFNII